MACNERSRCVANSIPSRFLAGSKFGFHLWRPGTGAVVLIHNPIPRARRKNLQRLEEFDKRILFRHRERLKGKTRLSGLAGMRQHRLPKSCEETVMEEGRLVCRSPKSLGQKAPVALLKLFRPGGLVHVQGFTLFGLANVV